MRVFLLNPPYGRDFCRSARWAARSRGRVQRHPDWLLIAAAVLERAGHAVTVLDGAARNLNPKEVETSIHQFQPDLLVLHTTTPSIENDLAYGLAGKDVGATVVAVGPHVTAVPEDTLRRGPALDAVAIGEYDDTLLDIAAGKNLSLVRGLVIRTGNGFQFTGSRPPVDVSGLPFPAWHHVQPEWYPDPGKRFPFLTLISGRGCPHACTFCRDTPLMYGRSLRLRHPVQVVDEMEHDRRLYPQIREIMFETDTFTASPAHVQGICEEILRRGLDRVPIWSCNARVDLELDLLPLMKRAGCRMLMVGFEFGSQKSLNRVKKGITLDQSRRFAETANRLGFTIHGCFMIGAPGETLTSAKETIAFACSLPLDTIQISGLTPYPGTELYEWARQEGFLVPRNWKEWVGPDFEQVTLLSFPQLSKQAIDGLIDRGLKKFYFRPSQVWRMISSIRSFDDLHRKFLGFRHFLHYIIGRRN